MLPTPPPSGWSPDRLATGARPAGAPTRARRRASDGLSSLRAAAGWDLDLATGRLGWADPTYRLVGARPCSLRPTMELWWSLVHEHDRPRVRAAFTLARASGQGYQEQLRLVGLDGVERVVHAWTEVATDVSGAVSRMFGAVVDVTGLGRLEHRDALTGLLGRAALEERGAAAVATASTDRCVALLVVDVDRFGRVNDTLGRAAGDQVLAEAARRVQGAVPVGSTVVRLGGDTFAALLTDLPTAGMARDAADDVVAALAEPMVLPGTGASSPAITASVGAAISDGGDVLDVEELSHRAELALHRAREIGPSSALVFRPEIGEAARARVRTEQVLREALAAQRLQVLYQPVVDLASGDVRGVEALCRVVDPTLGPLSPALFMDVAEETGLVTVMDEWVLRHATAFAARWEAPEAVRGAASGPGTTAGPGAAVASGRSGDPGGAQPPTVAVNMSPRSLARPDLARLVEEALAGAGAAGRRLLVEITEHSLLERGDRVRATLGALERLGVAVGVDDFGTGWSSLSYLSGLELGFLKIDRSFVARLGQDAAAESVVRTVVELAHAHDLVCIGEGVETQEQALALAAMGCDHGQGWWFGRPATEAALAGTVAAWGERARATGFGVRPAPSARRRRGRHVADA